jgi:CHAT domain-containing protein
MIELMLSQNSLMEALAYAERAKARTLLDVLYNGKIEINKAMSVEEEAEQQKLKNELNRLNTLIKEAGLTNKAGEESLVALKENLQKARFEYSLFQSKLYATHPELKIQRGEIPSIQLSEIDQLIPDNQTAILEYVLAKKQTVLFVVTKNGNGRAANIEIKAYSIPIEAKPLISQVNNFRQKLSQRDLEFSPPARQLYDLLIKPAQSILQNRTKLIIVPDALWELPFQALISENNHYLLQDYAISYTPSITALREMVKLQQKKATANLNTLLAFGNPKLSLSTISSTKTALMSGELSPLPEAEKQVQKLKLLYGADHSKIYIGTEASEERFKTEAGNSRLLHLATHGILDSANPLYSHVLLAQNSQAAKTESKEDGLLETWELMQLNLKADITILSACETARGQIEQGEGMIGMSWALFVAGCPTTIVSQWKVSAESTTELMLTFHENFKAGIENQVATTTKAELLQQAGLKLLKTQKYRHPFYWAGFIMVGNAF